MLDEERVERDPEPLGEDLLQASLGLGRRSGTDHAETVRDPVDVGVDGYRGDRVAEDQHAVRGLRPDARKGGERVERPRHVASVAIEELAGTRPDRPRLHPIEPGRANEFLDSVDRGPGERSCVRVPSEQGRGRAIRVRVARALRQDRPDQDLERILGVVPQVRPSPVPRPVEGGEAVQEGLPRERAGPRVPRQRRPRGAERTGAVGATAGFGRSSTPGSERSGSVRSSGLRRSSPIR